MPKRKPSCGPALTDADKWFVHDWLDHYRRRTKVRLDNLGTASDSPVGSIDRAHYDYAKTMLAVINELQSYLGCQHLARLEE